MNARNQTLEDDPLDDLFNSDPSTRRSEPAPVPASYHPRPTFIEACPNCRGTGRWGYSGRPCFKCQGSGRLTFNTTPERRERSRQDGARRRQNRVEERRASVEQFKIDHAAVWAWLVANRENQRFAFPRTMLEALQQFGGLTDNQLAACQRLVARDGQRVEERATRQQENSVTIDIGKIEASFEHARQAAAADGEGVKWLRLRLDTFTFTPAPAHGRNAGGIYVREGQAYLGKVMGGRFLPARECTDDQKARIVAAAADPAGAARTYGLRTGSCSCCGRELTNRASIDLGIGPICAAKYGWV